MIYTIKLGNKSGAKSSPYNSLDKFILAHNFSPAGMNEIERKEFRKKMLQSKSK